MLRKLDQMKMQNKMVFGYSVVIGMMIVLALISVVGLIFVNGKMNTYANSAQKADTAVKMCRIESNIAARNIREMALNGDTSSYDTYKENVKDSEEELRENLEILKKTGVLSDELYGKYETAITDWIAIGNEIITLLENGEREQAARKILDECAPALQNVIDIVKEIDVETDEDKTDALSSSHNTVVFDVVVIIAVLALAVLLAFRIGKRIIASITTPLKHIEEVAMELSNGNLHSQLDYHSDDEIGVLAHSLRKSIRILGDYVDDIDRSMQEFSNGNFAVQPSVEWKGDFINIKESILHFEAKMSETMHDIQQVADQVTSASEQVSANSMELAQGAADQAGITEKLTATIESVSDQIHQNANSAKSISRDVEAVGVEIINSNGKMQEMVKSMDEISESSNEISKIIATINDIATQTNLLALNASIEAARAGEAGKGFAVVADQVSVLAAQSAEAAKESTTLIEGSVRAVENGKVIADETARQLENVVKGSEEITEKVNQIAYASEEQADSISQINQGVEHINDVVQTNSATSQQCAASSEEMTGQAEVLENLVKKFKVGKF